MVKFKGVDGALKESLHDVVDYIQYELRLDIEYALLYVVAPILVGLLVIQGTFGLFKYLYKWIVPPGASELHRTALAALHHQKRFPRDQTLHYKEAETLFKQAIAKDELFFPAYLSLASLYIYRMKLPDQALAILTKAKDYGSMRKLEPLIHDAEALKMGGNEHMIQAGGGLFAEQDYLSITERYDKAT